MAITAFDASRITCELVVRWIDAKAAKATRDAVVSSLAAFGFPDIVEGTFDGSADLELDALAVYGFDQKQLDSAASALEARFAGRLWVSVALIPNEAWTQAWSEEVAGQSFCTDRFLLTDLDHHPLPKPSAAITIHLARGVAFGSGAHATTLAALTALEELPPPLPGALAVDCGTGNGVLAIATAKLGFERVVATETLAESLIEARVNAERNSVAFVEFHLSESLPVTPGSADLIVANIPIAGLIPLISEFVLAMKSNGRLIMAGFVGKELVTLTCACGAAGLKLQSSREVRGWTAAVFSLS